MKKALFLLAIVSLPAMSCCMYPKYKGADPYNRQGRHDTSVLSYKDKKSHDKYMQGVHKKVYREHRSAVKRRERAERREQKNK